jgi:NADH:ubiquinone oxidoreductase subunit F (NADH-binding)
VVQRILGGPALPLMTPPHVSETGVGGRPTLVQNAETLAHAALVARFGGDEFRRLGTAGMPGTTLLTLSGNVRRPGVYEVEIGSRVGDVLKTAGGVTGLAPGALLGGYFGGWIAGDELFERRLDTGLGCGVLAVLPEGACGIEESSRILDYLSAESAGQCGPCVHGLRAIAVTMQRIARSEGDPDDLLRLRRWSGLVRGRGACRHPDGAAGHLDSALTVFASHLGEHLAGTPCRGRRVAGFPRPPARFRWWR